MKSRFRLRIPDLTISTPAPSQHQQERHRPIKYISSPTMSQENSTIIKDKSTQLNTSVKSLTKRSSIRTQLCDPTIELPPIQISQNVTSVLPKIRRFYQMDSIYKNYKYREVDLSGSPFAYLHKNEAVQPVKQTPKLWHFKKLMKDRVTIGKFRDQTLIDNTIVDYVIQQYSKPQEHTNTLFKLERQQRLSKVISQKIQESLQKPGLTQTETLMLRKQQRFINQMKKLKGYIDKRNTIKLSSQKHIKNNSLPHIQASRKYSIQLNC